MCTNELRWNMTTAFAHRQLPWGNGNSPSVLYSERLNKLYCLFKLQFLPFRGASSTLPETLAASPAAIFRWPCIRPQQSEECVMGTWNICVWQDSNIVQQINVLIPKYYYINFYKIWPIISTKTLLKKNLQFGLSDHCTLLFCSL